MAKQANRMMIGGFVVAAVVLLAASLVVFGSGKFFKKANRYILYFDGSVKGLNVGAPVLFQGVQVGSVESITLSVNPETVKIEIPVVVAIEPDRFKVLGGIQFTTENRRESAKKLVDAGLRAVLTMQSFITGQLMIELDFFSNTPVDLKNISTAYPEIPTIPSTTKRLAQSLQNLDLEGMERNLTNTLAGINRFVNNPEINASIGELKAMLTDARQLAQNLNERIGPLADNLDATLRDSRKLVNTVDGQTKPLFGNVNKTVQGFEQLARDTNTRLGSLTKSMDKTLTGARGVMSEDAPLVIALETALREISDMARSFRLLADYLQRHPEALIQGKGESGGK